MQFSRKDKSVYQKVNTKTVAPRKEEEKDVLDDEPYIAPVLKDDGLNWMQRGWRRNYDNLTDPDRLTMLVDETFALYLHRVSQKLNA
jgi:hypothetical protein